MTASQPIFFSCWGTENRWCQIRKIWRVINPFKATVTHWAAIATTDLCAGALSWWNRTPFVSFPGHFEMSLVLLFSPELLIRCGFIWKKTMQLVSGKVDFSACQVSLLWHDSFLVSLWPFQLTLISWELCWYWVHHTVLVEVFYHLGVCFATSKYCLQVAIGLQCEGSKYYCTLQVLHANVFRIKIFMYISIPVAFWKSWCQFFWNF